MVSKKPPKNVILKKEIKKKPPPKIYINNTETQQSQFLEKYPNFDGRGLKIAIIDGGIDVSLPGLQKTSDGLPKIIDCFDCTGNGNIDTSAIRKLDENMSLIALSGRKLTIPLNWKNPSGEWHLGMKSAFDLCHSNLWDKELNKKLSAIFAKAEIAMKFEESEIENKKENLEMKELIDCIVWNDGEKWRSCFITAIYNDLENAKVLTNFRDDHDYSFLIDKITCCITISDNGNQVQVCTSTDEHGSCVAQIATASHFPDNKESDGLAPGAQIYFMEAFRAIKTNTTNDDTALANEKALGKCLELGVDIINISVDFWWADTANKRIKFLDEMQSRYGTIVVQSAGNEGPLFSTIQERMLTDTSCDSFLFIGSLITAEMNDKIYDWKSPYPPSPELYSSKGPSINNYSRAISFVAPGKAVIPSSQWISKDPQIKSGTSLAAPNAAGSIACLLSALKANSIPYTPAMIKFALSNTAIPLKHEDRLASGDGIIQIDAAFDFLKTYSRIIPRNFLQLSIADTKMKGIYIIVENGKPETQKFNINVKHFEEKIDKNIPWILKLLPQTNKNFITHSPATQNGTFDVEISTAFLNPGKLYYSEIQGFHPFHSIPFFHFPITVIVPKIANFFKTTFKIQSNTCSYIFLRPSPEATKCSFKLIGLFKKENICLLKKNIEKDSEKRNKYGIFEFYDEYCDTSIQWREELFQICFFKSEQKHEEKLCKFVVKFV